MCCSKKVITNSNAIIFQNCLQVRHTEYGSAAIRATHSIPPECDLFYYEVKIVARGEIKVGFSAKNVSTSARHTPGWEELSFGYHYDGKKYAESSTGTPYGSTFAEGGDIIGCGINLTEATCFYTKNGKDLGIAFTNLPKEMFYPMVGFWRKNAEIIVNFGQEPFVYNISLRKQIELQKHQIMKSSE